MAARLLDAPAEGGLSRSATPAAGAGGRSGAGGSGSSAWPVPLQAPLQAAVLDWWERARAERDELPWRSTRDPWAVLVSETMLVQTQAARVADRFPEVLERFPTPSALAAATPGEVLACWVGLGYNRRALWLQQAARRIVELHGGAVPGDLGALRALPGVGPYTARAVLAFAFEQPVGVVDTNIGRVLARAVAGARLSPGAAQAEADALVPGDRPRAWNLALMDLGALCCRPRPSCGSCPLGVAGCRWREGGGGDPAEGSAGTSRGQPPFAGSDRQGRGRLVRAALAGPVPATALAATAGWPDDPVRARRVAGALVVEGLLASDGLGGICRP